MTIFGYTEAELQKLGATDTANEIYNQPVLWKEIYDLLVQEKDSINTFLLKARAEVQKVILTGAGTSAFIGLSLQGMLNRYWKIHTLAVPTTDLVTHPENFLSQDENILMISFARSGNSPESMAAAVLADKLCPKCYHLIITCDPSGKLANYNGGDASRKHALILPPSSNDKSLAMTGSYSGMLLAGILLARLSELAELKDEIGTVIEQGTRILRDYEPRLRQAASMDFNRAVFLGSGPFLGTATESHLKLQELTDGQVICKQDSYLGFRHGPKAVTNEHTLVVFIFSHNPYVRQYERDLVKAMAKGKKPLYTIGIMQEKPTELDFDLEIALSGNKKISDEELLTVCYILPGQLLGFHKSIHLGLKPDAPSVSGAITRVVENVTIYSLNS